MIESLLSESYCQGGEGILQDTVIQIEIEYRWYDSESYQNLIAKEKKGYNKIHRYRYELALPFFFGNSRILALLHQELSERRS